MAQESHLPLADKVALVTGSGQGIGRAIAIRLAQAGADIIVNYRSKAATAAETQAAIEAQGVRYLNTVALFLALGEGWSSERGGPAAGAQS